MARNRDDIYEAWPTSRYSSRLPRANQRSRLKHVNIVEIRKLTWETI